MQKWEYSYLTVITEDRVYYLNGKKHQYEGEHAPTLSVLNELGAQGWEVAGMGIMLTGPAFILKRPLAEA